MDSMRPHEPMLLMSCKHYKPLPDLCKYYTNSTTPFSSLGEDFKTSGSMPSITCAPFFLSPSFDPFSSSLLSLSATMSTDLSGSQYAVRRKELLALINQLRAAG